ncbi:MAG: sugar transferase [Actinomycetaceae bacterium]|nr:sugar transferase [Actinomycetaceae bacterium]
MQKNSDAAVLLTPEDISSHPVYLFVKRVTDLFVSALVLVILFVPALLLCLAIRLDSPGSPLFKQQRVGKNGVPFVLYKFRSMPVDFDVNEHKKYVSQFINNQRGGEIFAHMPQRRITRIGRFIRKTSIDELPQLINVFKGDMSLVGPRPPIDYEVENYSAFQRQRILVKPGLTGYWQVHGRARVSFDDMVKMDVFYIRNRSLWMDLVLLLQTPYATIRGAG